MWIFFHFYTLLHTINLEVCYFEVHCVSKVHLTAYHKALLYSTVCITQKIVLKAKDLIKKNFIHEGKKPVKFVTLSILKRGPKIDILFMKERNLSNFLQ